MLKATQLPFSKRKFLASFYAFCHDRLKQGGLCHWINEYILKRFCHFYAHPTLEGKITAQDLFLTISSEEDNLSQKDSTYFDKFIKCHQNK